MTDADPAQHGPLPHLDTFSKAAERGSFTAAARELGITQAAVSQRVQVLERTLDVSLFERKGGRVSLTDSGTRLNSRSGFSTCTARPARRSPVPNYPLKENCCWLPVPFPANTCFRRHCPSFAPGIRRSASARRSMTVWP